ncbi:MAG: nodulation protein S NodS, partial [Flavobacteriaceae bacterium]|nr:nodulation protein S NodS [Flavobacteriaceae bacterium]
IMTLLKTKEWEKMLIEVGFKNVKSWTVGKTDNWNGTLVLSGTKN